MDTTAKNAAAPAGDRGSDAGTTWDDMAHVKRLWAICQDPHPVALPWAGRRAAELRDCAQALLDGARLGLLERLVIGRLKRRLARAVAGWAPPTYSTPESTGGPASWAAVDASRETLAQLDAAGLVSGNDPATRQAVGAALTMTAAAAYLGPEDRAALCLVAGREVANA